MKKPWLNYLSEFLGTALLVYVGISLVIAINGTGSPMVNWIPSGATRRLITGFLFGCTGATIAISWLGKQSGAHLNPLVTLAFLLAGRVHRVDAFGYIVAQMTGAIAGAFPLLLWGTQGRSVIYGATLPGAQWGLAGALSGEAVTTFAMITLLFYFLAHQRLLRFTPLLFPPLYSIMVWLEGPLSGTSTNTARSLGPAVIAGAWDGWWVYWIGPTVGMLIGLAWYYSPWMASVDVSIAKIYHHYIDPSGRLKDKAQVDHPCSGPVSGTSPS